MGNRGQLTTVGVSSLLAIFAVLCLTVFTLLTLSTVEASRTLSDKTASAALGYYRADLEAETTLAALRSGTVPAHVQQENGVYCYSHAISDTQLLAVEVAVEGSEYHILRWQAVPAADWQAGDGPAVWNGETKEEQP